MEVGLVVDERAGEVGLSSLSLGFDGGGGGEGRGGGLGGGGER